MKLELSFYGSLCSTAEFIINDIDADYNDFGEHYDASPDTAEDYSCGNRVFEPKAPTEEVLEKYKISGPEYYLIASQLEAGLSFGSCGLCS